MKWIQQLLTMELNFGKTQAKQTYLILLPVGCILGDQEARVDSLH